MEKIERPKPKRWITFLLIFSTMALSVVLFGGGIYSLYVSIGFKFLSNNTFAGINTSSLYTYSSSVFGTGAGRMVGLIIISIIMLALGIAMAIIFFKQLPLYRQIKLIRNLPTVKYKEFTKQTKKSVIVFSILTYIICIAFSVLSIVVASRSGLAYNYVWAVIMWYFFVLVLSIVSMSLMIVKIVQLSKIKKQIIDYELDNSDEQEKTVETQVDEILIEPQLEVIEKVPEEKLQEEKQPAEVVEVKQVREDKLFTDGIFELGDQLQKLREMHISGLIDGEEYILIREKWINAVLSEPLFGQKTKRMKTKKKIGIINQENVSSAGDVSKLQII